MKIKKCKVCKKRIPQARLKAVPETEHCVSCVDEHGEQFAVVPIFTEDNVDIAIIKDPSSELIEQINGLKQYETRMGS